MRRSESPFQQRAGVGGDEAPPVVGAGFVGAVGVVEVEEDEEASFGSSLGDPIYGELCVVRPPSRRLPLKSSS